MEKILEPSDERNSSHSGGASSTTKRRYNSTRRAEQAAETRRRIVDAAATCFGSRGYASTTLGQIAAMAGVSAESVAAHGPKRSLLIAAFEQSLAGSEGEEGISERPEMASLLALTDVDEFIEAVSHVALSAHSRTIGLWRALSAAADEDAEIAVLYQELSGRRRAEHRRIAELMAARGWLGAKASTERVGDTLALLAGFDPYQLFVREFGWSEEELRMWFVGAMRALVAD